MKVAIVYNKPSADRYQAMGESAAELGVLDEVKAVSQALVELKYGSVLIPLAPPLSTVKEALSVIPEQDVDVIFNLFEGFDGSPETEGQVAAMLAKLRLPFTGCPAEALTLALDKSKTKAILEKAGVPTPHYQVLTPDNLATFQLDFPCMVKPLADDASHGISEDSVVYDRAALEKQVHKISGLFDGRALVEEFLDGREFNTMVMGKLRPLVPAISEIAYTLPPDKPRILTFQAKWDESSDYYIHTKAVCPAPLNREEEEEIRKTAKAAFRLTGCRGYARVDLRQDRSGHFKVLEVNPNPDITPGAGAALQAAAAGMPYSQFIKKIIHYALI